MDARAIDDAELRLRQLRQDEWAELGVAGGALALAVVAAIVLPGLALPLFVGGLVVGALGIRALWRRWDLVDRLAGESDAYVISEVRSYAVRASGMTRRRSSAATVRCLADECARSHDSSTASLAAELAALAADLENSDLALDPACAVACARLLDELAVGALTGPTVAPELVRSRVRRIRSGFASRTSPA